METHASVAALVGRAGREGGSLLTPHVVRVPAADSLHDLALVGLLEARGGCGCERAREMSRVLV